MEFAARSKDATRAPGLTTRNKKLLALLLGARTLLGNLLVPKNRTGCAVLCNPELAAEPAEAVPQVATESCTVLVVPFVLFFVPFAKPPPKTLVSL